MSKTATAPATCTLSALPAICQPFEGGLFAGLTTKQDGTHCAVVLLADRPQKALTWAAAKTWAKKVGGELPNRPVAALLFATLRKEFDPVWHWTSEASEFSGSYAWGQDFSYGGQFINDKSYEGRARAVRLIHLVP